MTRVIPSLQRNRHNPSGFEATFRDLGAVEDEPEGLQSRSYVRIVGKNLLWASTLK